MRFSAARPLSPPICVDDRSVFQLAQLNSPFRTSLTVTELVDLLIKHLSVRMGMEVS